MTTMKVKESLLHFELESKDAIATIQHDFPEMTTIYGYNESMTHVTACTGSALVYDRNYVDNQKPRAYKLYESGKDGSYFVIDGKRHYLRDATPTLAGMGW